MSQDHQQDATRPAHHRQGRIEVWDFIDDQQLGYFAGNVLKYVCRYRHKGTPLEDLRRARACLDRLITAESARPGRADLNKGREP